MKNKDINGKLIFLKNVWVFNPSIMKVILTTLSQNETATKKENHSTL